MCSNQTEEVDPITVYDPQYVNHGWGFLLPHEEPCHSTEEIKEFLEKY